jgi:hypothetical protein
MTLPAASAETTVPEIALDIPPDFHEVPLESAVEDRVAAQNALLEGMGLRDTEQREGLGLYLEAIARTLAGSPIVGTAFCAVAVDGRPSTATLTVATQATSSSDRLVVLAGTAEALRRTGSYAHVSIESAGSHRAVFASGAVGTDGLDLHQTTAVVPVPSHPLAVLVTIATPSRDDVATYERVVRSIAGSLRVVTSSAE